MGRIIRSFERTNGGFNITVEVTGAYTDGSSRLDTVWVSRDDMRGKTQQQRRQAIFDALEDDPLGDAAGLPAERPAQTREVFEDRAIAKFEAWQRWKLTREEAQARGLAGGVITSLTNREDAAWSDYLDVLIAWRSAPSS